MAFNFVNKDYWPTTPTRLVDARVKPFHAFIAASISQTMVPLGMEDDPGPYTAALYSSCEPHLEIPPWPTPLTALLSPPSQIVIGRNDAEDLNLNLSDQWFQDLSVPSCPTASLPFHLLENHNLSASRPQFAAPTLILTSPISFDEPHLYSARDPTVKYPMLNQVASPSAQAHAPQRSSLMNPARKRCLCFLSLTN
jgi:hypothetical protein